MNFTRRTALTAALSLMASAAFAQACPVKSSTFKQRAATLGIEPRYLGPEVLAALVVKDTEYGGKVIKSRNILAD